MSTIVVPVGGLVVKDPADIKVYAFDWDTYNLGVGVTITTSVFTVTAIAPIGDTALTKDQESVLLGDRKTQLRLSAGTLGAKYRIDNKITTNESPSQTKERSFYVKIENK